MIVGANGGAKDVLSMETMAVLGVVVKCVVVEWRPYCVTPYLPSEHLCPRTLQVLLDTSFNSFVSSKLLFR